MVLLVRLVSSVRASHEIMKIIGGIVVLATRQELRWPEVLGPRCDGLLQRLTRHLLVVFKRLEYRFRAIVPATATVIRTFNILEYHTFNVNRNNCQKPGSHKSAEKTTRVVQK